MSNDNKSCLSKLTIEFGLTSIVETDSERVNFEIAASVLKNRFAKIVSFKIWNYECYFLFCFVSGNLFSSFSEQNRMQSCTKEQQLLILKQIAKCCVHHLCSAIFVWWTCKVEFGSFSTFVEAKLNREKWSWCWLPVGGLTPSSELLALPAARNFLECENI